MLRQFSLAACVFLCFPLIRSPTTQGAIALVFCFSSTVRDGEVQRIVAGV